MITEILKIGEISYGILNGHVPAMRLAMAKPKVENAECVEAINYAEVMTIDYAAIRQQIEENNTGEGCSDFAETYETDSYTAHIEGMIFRKSTETGDGYWTPRETIEEIEIDVDSWIFYNMNDEEIGSDFDAYCV